MVKSEYNPVSVEIPYLVTSVFELSNLNIYGMTGKPCVNAARQTL